MKLNPIIINEQLKDKINLEMVLVPKGQFLMGSNENYKDEQPVHKVNMKSFYMSKYPITQAQYESVMGNNPSHFKGENNPVECVSWYEAQEFCKRLSQQTGKKYRLPSEAQWEYACRAGSKNKYCFGNDESQLKDYAWHSRNSDEKTHPVGLKKPNKWGLYDMHGNVWEWCEDDWHDSYNDAPTDGSAWIETQDVPVKIMRGGSFGPPMDTCRSAYRSSYYALVKIGRKGGFRVVCVV